MSEKFKLAFGSDSEFFGHNANSQRLRVTKTPVDVSEDIYFYTLVIRSGRVGLDTVERCRRGFVRERCCGSRGWRVSLDTAKRCRREFVGEIGVIKRKMGCILRGQMIIYNEIYRKECFRA